MNEMPGLDSFRDMLLSKNQYSKKINIIHNS